MTKLPAELEKRTINKMKSGEHGFTLPWAIEVDTNRDMWIDPDFPVFNQARGTAHLEIIRRDNDVLVFSDSLKDHRFNPAHFIDPDQAVAKGLLPVEMRGFIGFSLAAAVLGSRKRK